MSLASLLSVAQQARTALRLSLEQQDTDCFRLFHGAVEGRPGLSIDKYGPLTVAQVSHSSPLSTEERVQLLAVLQELAPAVLAVRRNATLALEWESSPGHWDSLFWCRELGLEFAIKLSQARRDPQLFLDFRNVKTSLKQSLTKLAAQPSVLNLFAYTCSVSCHAAAAGADEVWSVDFSSGNLAWGEKNFRRNRLSRPNTHFLEEDCLGLLWSLSGNQKALSGRKGRKLTVAPRRFSAVIVDPPAWSKGKFGAVDLVRDPETVYRPAWQVVAPGGLMIVSNNSAKVSRQEFSDRLSKMLSKEQSAHPCQSWEWIAPPLDFPTFDGEHPLKTAICWKAV